jgi:hypothetical protein
MFQHSKLYPYLNNPQFLFQLAKEQVVELHAKLTVLDFQERPIQDVTGRIVNGSLNIDGQSAVRRTGNLTVFVEHDTLSYMEIGGLFSLNKKIKIELGVANTTDSYTNYPVIWFPQGIFAIVNLSSSHSTSGTSITLQVRDKMVFLNGECGGTITAATSFHEYDEIDPETGEYFTHKPTIIQIIRELVNHFGGEQLGRIFINDLDSRVKKVMRWNHTQPVYFYSHKIHSNLRYLTLTPFRAEESLVIKELQEEWEAYEEEYNEIMDTREPEEPGVAPPYSEAFYLEKEKEYESKRIKIEDKIAEETERIELESPIAATEVNNFICTVYQQGQDIGYTYSDFYFPDELTANAGDTVCAILDKIKTALGNYEYFYDINGNFVFQEIKNYLNTTQSTTVINNLKLVQQLTADRQKYLEESEQLINALPEGEEKNNAKITQQSTLNRFDAQIFNATAASEVRNYLVDRTSGKAMYIFDDSEIITSFSNSPQYPQIKNDFVVWGMRETVDGTLPIRYHLAIDKKPATGNIYQCHFFKDPDSINLSTLEPIEKAGLAIELYEAKGDMLPEVGAVNRLYVYIKEDGSRHGYYWDPDETKSRLLTDDSSELQYLPTFKKLVEEDQYILQEFPGYIGDEKIAENWNKDEVIVNGEILLRQEEDTKTIVVDKENYIVTIIENTPDGKLDKKTSWETHTKYHPTEEMHIKTTDWRSELYLQGVNSSRYGNNSNYYYTELENEWPKLYDLKSVKQAEYYEGDWREETLANPASLDFFLDFIDSSAAISAFNVSAIGRRSKVVVDDKINCLFEPDIPDYIFIDNTAENREEMIKECNDKGQPFITLNSDLYTNLIQGGTYNSAFNLIQDLLYQHTGYNESITLQTLPLYFLEPNIRIAVRDSATGIYGDYVLNSFSMPLDIGGTMSLSCTRALDRI